MCKLYTLSFSHFEGPFKKKVFGGCFCLFYFVIFLNNAAFGIAGGSKIKWQQSSSAQSLPACSVGQNWKRKEFTNGITVAKLAKLYKCQAAQPRISVCRKPDENWRTVHWQFTAKCHSWLWLWGHLFWPPTQRQYPEPVQLRHGHANSHRTIGWLLRFCGSQRLRRSWSLWDVRSSGHCRKPASRSEAKCSSQQRRRRPTWRTPVSDFPEVLWDEVASAPTWQHTTSGTFTDWHERATSRNTGLWQHAGRVSHRG